MQKSVKTIGELTTPHIEQRAPVGRGQFTYVDIGSIDRETKHICEPKRMPIEKAPSRAKQVLKSGDVLVSMTRPNLNAVAIVPPDLDGATGSTGFHVLRSESEDPKFLFYAVQTTSFIHAMCQRVQGALYPAVRPKDINSFTLPLLNLSEQKLIVSEIEKQFSRLDAGVAALRRVQANLKRYRAAVLKAACEGRLVPTEAELARREGRSYETGEQLLARILAERRAAHERAQATASRKRKYVEPTPPDTSTLPPLLEGWAWASVEQLSTMVQYGSSSKTTEDSTGVPVLRMGNIDDGKLVLDSLKYLPKSHDEFPNLFLENGDLVFNRTNSAELVGKTTVFRGIPKPCSFASYLIRVSLSSLVKPDIIAYYINSVFGRAWIKSVVSQQVGQANVNGTKLQALSVPLPPTQEQIRIVTEVERRLSIVEELESDLITNLQRGVRLRQSTLQKAFQGER